MQIVAECAACGARFKASAQYAGARVKCPGCRKPVTLAHLIVAALPDGMAAPKPQPKRPQSAGDSNSPAAPPNSARRGKRRLLAVSVAAVLIVAAVVWPDADFPQLNMRAEVSAAEGTSIPTSTKVAEPGAPTVKMPALKDYAAENFTLTDEPTELAVAESAQPTQPGDSKPSSFDGWLQDFEAAKVKAAAEKKDILVAFHFDDDLSSSMVDDVFFQEEFREKTKAKFVLMLIEVLERREPRVKIENEVRNRKLAERFQIEPYDGPMTVLTDAEGRPYGFDLYIGCGIQRFFEDIGPYDEQRRERDRILTKIASSTGPEKLAAIERGFKFLQEQGLLPHYGAMLDQWLAFARTADSVGKVAEELFYHQWLVKVIEFEPSGSSLLNLFKFATVNQLLAELEQWKKDRPFKDRDREAMLNMYAGGMLAAVGRTQEAVRYVEAGIALEPDSPELLVQLQRALIAVQGITGMGSGFIVSSDGYVLTNHHVVEGAGRLMIQLPGRKEQVAAYVVAQDEKRDMALLKIRLPKEQLPAISISVDELTRGTRVGAFGFPSSDITGSGLKLTTGIVSATTDHTLNRMLLLDCRVNPGNSGGPLCDTRGRVVGMVTAKSLSGGELDSYGMALPGKDLDAFLKQHLPGYTPDQTNTNANENRQEWDEIDPVVSRSVVMVIQKQ